MELFPVSAAHVLYRVAEELIFLHHNHSDFCTEQIELLSHETDQWHECHAFLSALIYLNSHLDEEDTHETICFFYLGQHLVFKVNHLSWIKSKNEFKELKLSSNEKNLVMNHGNILAGHFDGTCLGSGTLKATFPTPPWCQNRFGFSSFPEEGLKTIKS